ncbi:hypothetical protein EDC01DRAFT_650357 [Geopyxis carbonaria]|nr:hypothetical protein EDC01DRAFT_650357 [Geopyxis carbonaria]
MRGSFIQGSTFQPIPHVYHHSSIANTTMDAHRMIYEGLQKLKRQHPGLTGKELLKTITDPPACSVCSGPSTPPTKQCSACKAVIYCSVACQKRAWSNQFSSGKTHKFLCPKFKRHMKRNADMKAILDFFPWGFVCDVDGSFLLQWFLAERNLLGSTGFGFWSEPPTFSSHDQPSIGNPLLENMDAEALRSTKYINGYMLLKDLPHPDPRDGWLRLPDSEIPWYDFTDHPEALPSLLDDVIESWSDWYTWRGLLPSSPVALIMHQVLSVYFMLTHSLDYFPLDADTQRETLHFDLIGAERELNIIPLFAELALLLPGYDLKLTFWGPSVHALGTRVGPDSLVNRDGPVFAYTAPASLGGSTLSVSLATQHTLWQAPPENAATPPDALLALNAGMGSSQNEWWPVAQNEWSPVAQYALVSRVPFVFTDYQESFLEVGTSDFVDMLRDRTLDAYRARPQPLPPGDEADYQAMLRKGSGNWTVRWNPFQRPGKEGANDGALPNTANGFVFELIV